MEIEDKVVNGAALKKAMTLIEQDMLEKLSIEDVVAGDNVTILLEDGNLVISAEALQVRGSMWYFGTEMTGNSTDPVVFSSTELAESQEGDVYININTYNLYQCTTGGDASQSQWVYKGCTRGLDDKIAIQTTQPENNAALWINPDGQSVVVAEINDNDKNSRLTTLSSQEIIDSIDEIIKNIVVLNPNTNISTYTDSLTPNEEQDLYKRVRIVNGQGVPTSFGYENGKNNDFWYDIYLSHQKDYSRLIAHDLLSAKTFTKIKTNGAWGDWCTDTITLVTDLTTTVTGYGADATTVKILNDKITKLEQAIQELSERDPNVLPDTTIMCIGDGITAGDGDDTYEQGYVRILTENDMTVSTLAVSDIPLGQISGYNNLLTSIKAEDYTSKDAYLIFAGLEDYYKDVPVGTMSNDYTTFDLTTFAGALEESIKFIHEQDANAHIVYVTIFKIGWDPDPSSYMIVARQICEKWGVPVIDLYNEASVDMSTTERQQTYLQPNTLSTLNTQGHALVGGVIANKLKPILATTPNIISEGEIPTPVPSTTDDTDYSVINYGADATGTNFSTSAFKQAISAAKSNGKKAYVPAGTYKLKWVGEDWTCGTDEMDVSILQNNISGTGDIIIDAFPQPGNRATNYNTSLISAKYEDCFGKFNTKNIDKDMIIDMHLTHEARSNMNMYHVNFGPVKRHYEPDTSNPDSSGRPHPRFNCWGQIALRYDKEGTTLPTGNVNVNIGKIGLLVYNQGVWSIHGNPYCEDGAMFDKTFSTWDSGQGGATKTAHDDYVTYTMPWSWLNDALLHFWCPAWTIPNPTTIQYIIGFCECWLDNSNPQYTDWLCFNLGIDMVTPAGEPYTGANKDHDEFLTGRFKKLTPDRRFVFGHNVRGFETDSVFADYDNLMSMINNKTITVY